MEIDLSTLSETQKKFYVQLLAQSNLQFTKKDNQFVAQFKVDPNQLKMSPMSSTASQQQQAVLTPHCSNKMKTKNQGKKAETVRIPSKKALSKVVKLGQLTIFQVLHPQVEVYIYPKRMSVVSLQETIEVVYQKFWQQHKKKNSHLRSINLSKWVYENVVSVAKDKLKIEQRLTNLIDSVNYYQIKMQGVKVFHHFLTERWPIDSFFYFLVLRGLLEQVTNQRILDKLHGNQSSSGTLGYKLRSSPFEKNVSEEQVSTFLGILKSQGLFCSKTRPKSFEIIFQQLTQKMFFDDQRKRNFIPFYELLQYLVVEFMDTEVSSCDMSLSKTEFANEDESISELITDEQSHLYDPNRSAKPLAKKEQTYSYSVSLEPADEELFVERQIQQRSRDLKQELKTMLMDRVNEMYQKLGVRMSDQLLQVLMMVFRAITELDKYLWINYRQSVCDAELLAIERLQQMFRNNCQSVVLTRMVKNMLLLPVIRQLITRDITL